MNATQTVPTNPDEHNGWTNRETWAVALHIDNDQGFHLQQREMCKEAISAPNKSAHLSDKQAAAVALERSLQEWVEEMSDSVYFPDGADFPANQAIAGMFHDIGSLWRVNWREIAENFLSAFDE